MENEEKNIKEKNETGQFRPFSMNLPSAIIFASILISIAIAIPKISSVEKDPPVSDSSKYDDTKVLLDETKKGGLLIYPVDENDYKQGASNPRITIVEFSDFGCVYCAKFHPSLEKLIEEYPEDVAWVYRQLPYRHLEASRAAVCVGEHLGNENFWLYTENLFNNQQSLKSDFLESEAVKIGFDKDEFKNCLSSEEISDDVERDFAEARIIGAQGTPYSVVIDSKSGREFPLNGALDYETLKTIVETIFKS